MIITIEVDINRDSCEECNFCESKHDYGFCKLFDKDLYLDEDIGELTPCYDCIIARKKA